MSLKSADGANQKLEGCRKILTSIAAASSIAAVTSAAIATAFAAAQLPLAPE